MSGLHLEPTSTWPTVDEWNGLVRDDPDASYCHLAQWREIMEDVLGHRTLCCTVRDDDGVLAGLLPLVLVRAAPLGRYLISMPFQNHGGALGSDRARQLLAVRAATEAARHRVDLLELRADRAEGVGLRRSDRKITVLLDLPGDSHALWREGLSAKVRSQIRRPLKDGMEARFGVQELPAFYEVFARHMRDLGTPVLPRRYFERIVDAFADLVELCTIYHRDTPVAVGLGFVWNGEFEMDRASALRAWAPSAPNMLLYWSLMERAIQRGVRRFNFGRCSPGSGTHRFKAQWGGRDVPLPWLQWAPGDVLAPPGDQRPLLRAAAATWRHVPLRVATRLGPFLARRLP